MDLKGTTGNADRVRRGRQGALADRRPALRRGRPDGRRRPRAGRGIHRPQRLRAEPQGRGPLAVPRQQPRAGRPAAGRRRHLRRRRATSSLSWTRTARRKRRCPRPNDVCAAAKFRDGSIALLTNGGALVHLDESGKELKTLPLNLPVLAVGDNIEALPDGHVLIPVYSTNKVVEVDADGKTVWEITTRQPTSAVAPAERPHAGRQPPGTNGGGAGPRRQGSEEQAGGGPAVPGDAAVGAAGRAAIAGSVAARPAAPTSASAARRSG